MCNSIHKIKYIFSYKSRQYFEIFLSNPFINTFALSSYFNKSKSLKAKLYSVTKSYLCKMYFYYYYNKEFFLSLYNATDVQTPHTSEAEFL